MKIGFFFALAVSALVQGVANALPENPAEYAAWEQGMLQGVRDQRSKPPEEAIPKLGLWVYQLSSTTHKERDGRPVFTAAQDALIAIPGHAEYYAKKIKDAQREVERQRGVSGREGAAKSKLLEEQMYGFATLRQLPTPETVRVLGEFLLDPWGLRQDAKPGEDPNRSKFGEGSHAENALAAIARLPLETRANTTPAEMTTYWKDIDAWKLWYEQVKAGNRTFRFKGDPREYNLNGPVEKASLARSRKDGPADASVPVAAEEPSPFPVAALAAACAVLGVAVWFVIGAKKRRKA